jgi:hypothetical protein
MVQKSSGSPNEYDVNLKESPSLQRGTSHRGVLFLSFCMYSPWQLSGKTLLDVREVLVL